MPRRRKRRIPALLIVVPLCLVALLIVAATRVEREPISSREILAKEEWEREELVAALARATATPRHRGTRREVLAHLREQLERFPEPERQAIVRDSVRQSVAETHRQWQAMPTAAREKLLETLIEQTRKNRKTLADLPASRRQAIKERLDSAVGREWRQTMQQEALSRFSSEDRQRLAPLVKEWIQTLESL